MEEVTKNIEKDLPAVKELANRLRLDIPIYKMGSRNAFQRVAGADAGSQILPLASRRYAVISSLIYSLLSGSRFFLPPESITIPYDIDGDGFRALVNIRRESKLYETAFRFVEDRPDLELLLIDGPLAFSNWWSKAGSKEDRMRLVDSVRNLLTLCRDERIVVLGIVKRPSARYLIYNLKLQNSTKLPDSFLLLHALKPKERTEIFSPRSALRRAVRSSAIMDAISLPIYSFYGRFSKEWSIPPIRVDLPAYCLAFLDEIVDYCNYSSFWEGIPLAIIRADEEVRISKSFMSEIYADMIEEASHQNWDVSHLTPYWGEGKWMGV